MSWLNCRLTVFDEVEKMSSWAFTQVRNGLSCCMVFNTDLRYLNEAAYFTPPHCIILYTRYMWTWYNLYAHHFNCEVEHVIFLKRNISEFWLGQQKISCAQRLYMICCGLQWQRNSGADLEILFLDSIRFDYNELWQQAPVLTRFALTYHMLLQQYHHHPGGNCHNKLYPEWWWWVK